MKVRLYEQDSRLSHMAAEPVIFKNFLVRHKLLFLILVPITFNFGAEAKLTDIYQFNGTITSGTESQSTKSSATNYGLNQEPTTPLKKTPSVLQQNASALHPMAKQPHNDTKDADKDKLNDNFSLLKKGKGTTQPMISVSLPPTYHNGTHRHVERKHSKLYILEYVLIPAGSLLLIFLLFVGCRHWQKVQRKRRLERELLHQYSYPNSEADEDMDYQSLPEVESVVNNQFVAFTDNSDKTLLEELPEVAVSMAGANAKLVLQETPTTPEETHLEQSTSFSC